MMRHPYLGPSRGIAAAKKASREKAAALARENDPACAIEDALLRRFHDKAEQKTLSSFEDARFNYVDAAREVFGANDGQEPPPISRIIQRLDMLSLRLRVGDAFEFLKFHEEDEMRVEAALSLPRGIRYTEYIPRRSAKDPECDNAYSSHDLIAASDETDIIETLNTSLFHVGIYGTIRARELNCREAENLFAEACCALNELYVASEPDDRRDFGTCKRILSGILKGVQRLWFADQVAKREKEIEETSKAVAKMAQKDQLGPHAKKMGVKEVDFKHRVLTIKGCDTPVQFPQKANRAWAIYECLLTSTNPDGYVDLQDDMKPVKAHFNRTAGETKDSALLAALAGFIGTRYKRGQHGTGDSKPAIFLKPLDANQIKMALPKCK